MSAMYGILILESAIKSKIERLTFTYEHVLIYAVYHGNKNKKRYVQKLV